MVVEYLVGELFVVVGYVLFFLVWKWSVVLFVEFVGIWVMGVLEMVFGDRVMDMGEVFGCMVMVFVEFGCCMLVFGCLEQLLIVEDIEVEWFFVGVLFVFVFMFWEQVWVDVVQILEYFVCQDVGICIIFGDNLCMVVVIVCEVGFDVVEGFDVCLFLEDDVEFVDVFDWYVVFGCVIFEQKKCMVMVLQSYGYIVVMMGDGVNDVFVIKVVDIGIVMNLGLLVMKVVVWLVFFDGQFLYLLDVVVEGCQVIVNIEWVLMLFFNKMVYVIFFVIIFGVFVFEFLFLLCQLFIIDGFMIGIFVFFLVFMLNVVWYIFGFFC